MEDANGEAARLRALADYQLLDTPRDPRLDALVAEAAAAFGTPMATLTLIDRDRQWFKAAQGMTASETPLDESFCAQAIRSAELLVVSNATRDERFRDMACVTAEDGIRFYAGAPLTLRSGTRVGTICVIDRTPRAGFDEHDRRLLAQLAARAVAEFELARDFRHEGCTSPGSEAEWLTVAHGLLGRASLALERCGATAALARLQEAIDEVDELAGCELV